MRSRAAVRFGPFAVVLAARPQWCQPSRQRQPCRSRPRNQRASSFRIFGRRRISTAFRVGFMHLSVEEMTPSSGTKYLRAARDLNFSVRRGPDVARIKALTGTDETPDGKVARRVHAAAACPPR